MPYHDEGRVRTPSRPTGSLTSGAPKRVPSSGSTMLKLERSLNLAAERFRERLLELRAQRAEYGASAALRADIRRFHDRMRGEAGLP